MAWTANIDAKVKASVMFDGSPTHNCQLVIQMRGQATDRLSPTHRAKTTPLKVATAQSKAFDNLQKRTRHVFLNSLSSKLY